MSSVADTLNIKYKIVCAFVLTKMFCFGLRTHFVDEQQLR